MPDTRPVFDSEFQAEVHGSEETGYYVFWRTSNAYGARGSGLTRAAAEDLAVEIRKAGRPNA